MSWVASLTLEAKGNRDPFVTQHLGAPPPTDPPFSLGQGHSSPLPVKVLRLSSLSNCNSSLLESHPPLSLNLVCPSHPFLFLSLMCVSLSRTIPEKRSLASLRCKHHSRKAGRDNNTNVLCKSDHGPQPGHILTGAVVRLNQYVSPHRPRIAYSQRGPAPVLGFQIKTETFQRCLYLSVSLTNCLCSLPILIESE